MQRPSAVGLYVHVPFCVRACPYCAFDFVAGGTVPFERYLAGLRHEVEARALHGTVVDTVYVGGGTPTSLGTTDLDRLCAWIRTTFDVSSTSEWTVEANPEHVDTRTFAHMASAGVTRVSLGVQSLRPEGLRQLGRVHSPHEGAQAIESALAAGLDTTADLIVGWPGQTPRGAFEEAGELAALGVGHLSIYALTIEPDTPWVSLMRRGQRMSVDNEAQTDALVAVDERLRTAGFDHYEVASYARPGAMAVHNQKYWTGGDVIGLGPSATSTVHARADGYTTTRRRANPTGFSSWSADPQVVTFDHLEGDAAAAEALWLGLRLLRGVDTEAFLVRFPRLSRRWIESRVAREVTKANLVWSGTRLHMRSDRWLWHDAVGVSILG